LICQIRIKAWVQKPLSNGPCSYPPRAERWLNDDPRRLGHGNFVRKIDFSI
jgi:hypothetical protein